jgi:hypothetical protein
LTDVAIPHKTSRIIYHVSPSEGGTITLRLEQTASNIVIDETA